MNVRKHQSFICMCVYVHTCMHMYTPIPLNHYVSLFLLAFFFPSLGPGGSAVTDSGPWLAILMCLPGKGGEGATFGAGSSPPSPSDIRAAPGCRFGDTSSLAGGVRGHPRMFGCMSLGPRACHVTRSRHVITVRMTSEMGPRLVPNAKEITQGCRIGGHALHNVPTDWGGGGRCLHLQGILC